MLDGEIYVLQAVRDTLRTKLNLTEFQCECEQDENIPATTGETYVAVIPGGYAFGPKQRAGFVTDSQYSVKVTVFKRCSEIAKDRNRIMLLDAMKGVNALLSKVMLAIDWQIDVMNLTNHLLWNDLPNSDPFTEMLRLTACDASTRMINSETYAATGGKGYVARARSVVFGGCRRVSFIKSSN